MPMEKRTVHFGDEAGLKESESRPGSKGPTVHDVCLAFVVLFFLVVTNGVPFGCYIWVRRFERTTLLGLEGKPPLYLIVWGGGFLKKGKHSQVIVLLNDRNHFEPVQRLGPQRRHRREDPCCRHRPDAGEVNGFALGSLVKPKAGSSKVNVLKGFQKNTP